MKKKHFGEKGERTFSPERAEAMPAAIITAIISSLLLLGIATVVSLVVQNKSDSEGSVELTSIASNIDVSLRSDITQATYLTGAAKLKQPDARLLTPTDVLLSGVNMHIPESTGECKVIRWNINGNTASRDLTIYQTTQNADSIIKCDTSSAVVAERTKLFAKNVDVKAPFEFTNQVGRELAFTITENSLNTVNTELDKQLNEKGVEKLSDEEFNELNKLMVADGYAVGFRDPAACVMNAERTADGSCPPAEADTVAAAWNSLKIAKVSVDFEMQNSTGEVAKRDISQNSSVPLYANAAEAEAAVAGSSADNRPVPPTVNLSTNRVILGTNYNINWTSTAICPADTARTFKLYENGFLIRTQPTAGFTKNYIDSSTEFVNYTVQVECVRGALVVNSDMSAPATAKVIPATPVLNITNAPMPSNAPLNSNISANANCLYGTIARYNLVQAVTTWGSPGSLNNLSSVNRAINSGLTVVEGARYQYRVEAWCVSNYDQSTTTNQTTNPFVTVINAPAAPPVFTAPSNGQMNVSPNVTVRWNPIGCPMGTTTAYFLAKNMDAGNYISPITMVNWSGALGYTANDTQGNRVGYTSQARCNGTAAISNPSPSAAITYTTLIDAPSMPRFLTPAYNQTDVDTGTTVAWTSVTCAPATSVQYYMVKNMDAGISGYYGVGVNWATATNVFANNTQGNLVGYSVKARCAGPNANSTETAEDYLNFTTRIDAPAAPAFTAPANNATNVVTNATITWSAPTCATGTSIRYYMVQTQDAGSNLSPWPIKENWTSNVSHLTDNTEGNRVSYAVAARCQGPNATSSNSPSGTLTYTTLINAPADVTFIDPTPAEGATEVSTSAVLTWSAVVCGPGTAPKYYTTKDVNAGAAITPIVIDNWTGDTSYTTNAAEGHTVRYTVKARCAGSNANSAETATDYRQYTTLTNAPGAPSATNNAWGTVSWTASSDGCAASTSIQYRVHQTKADNNVVSAWGAWTTALAAVLPTYNTGGYPQWAEVQARCVGPNDTSAGTMSNTTKWVKRFDISFGAWQAWRRINVTADCPYATTVDDFHLYVAADGWGGTRGTYGGVYTDEGAWIADAQAGGGGNTGWLYLKQTQNTQWNDVELNDTTHQWGYWGNAGWGTNYAARRATGTYWNAGGWGSWAYWYTGRCESPYMHVYEKGTVWTGGTIRNAGTPGTHYNAWPASGYYYTQAGVDATK